MLSPQQKKKLHEQAERLAAELAGSQVTRSEWRRAVDALYLVPGPAEGRVKRANELIDALPNSWVSNRSKRTRQQLNQVRQTFRQVMRQRLSAEELRYLVGWTSRLLHVRGHEARRSGHGGRSRHGGGGGKSFGGRRR